MITLNNKIIFITGASAGIGQSCATAFAREVADKLKKKFKTDCHIISIDVRNQDETAQKIGSLPATWKKIDILLNNAGLSRGLSKIHDGELTDWEEMIDTNIRGLLYVSRIIIPLMVKRKKGHIVNIGSIAGHEVYPGGNVYCATKHAVDAITKGMQIDLVDTPLRVSTVDPGMVETEFSLVRFHGDSTKAKSVYKGLKPLTSDDVADAVLFCCTRPAHVNIHQLRIMPVAQASAAVVYRK